MKKVCQYFVQRRCWFDQHCWNTHPERAENRIEPTEVKANTDARKGEDTEVEEVTDAEGASHIESTAAKEIDAVSDEEVTDKESENDSEENHGDIESTADAEEVETDLDVEGEIDAEPMDGGDEKDAENHSQVDGNEKKCNVTVDELYHLMVLIGSHTVLKMSDTEIEKIDRYVWRRSGIQASK